MTTREQYRWMELIELLNSDHFDFPCSWFEDSNRNRSTLMANRTPAAERVPQNAYRMKIDGKIWVRGDEWIEHDIEAIYNELSTNAEYVANIVDDVLYIELSRDHAV